MTGNKMESVLVKKMGMKRRQAKKVTKTAKNFAYDVSVQVGADLVNKGACALGSFIGKQVGTCVRNTKNAIAEKKAQKEIEQQKQQEKTAEQ